jgi:large subunit ribosomal protein L35
MPKMKTKKSAAKRYKITGSGNISYVKGGNSHFGVRKSSKRKRRLRKTVVMAKAMSKRTKLMV